MNEFWKYVNKNIQNQDGPVEFNKDEFDEMEAHMKQSFNQEYNSNSFHNDICDEVNKHIEMVKANLRSCNFPKITQKDINTLIKGIKVSNFCVYDQVSNAMLKTGLTDNLTKIIADLFNSVIETNCIPKNFNMSIILPIPKSKDILHYMQKISKNSITKNINSI